MRPSLKALKRRAEHAAEGDPVPAGQEPVAPDEEQRPGAVERGTLRRRLRRARRMREALLTEVGALVMEMHRQGRHNPALVERKAREALVVDREVTGLARALGVGTGLSQVVAAGIAGGCPACGALVATDDRFCPRCGTQLAARNGAVAAPPAAPPPQPAAAPPPPAGARVAGPAAPPPPAPGTREPAPGAPPPPDPSTRVPRTGDTTTQIAPG